jgi:hypothetical protein
MRYIVILIDFPENAKSSSKNFEVITALPFVFNQDGEQGTDKSYFFDTYKTTNPAKWVGGGEGQLSFWEGHWNDHLLCLLDDLYNASSSGMILSFEVSALEERYHPEVY